MRRIVFTLLLAALSLCALAQEKVRQPTAEDIIDKLKPPPPAVKLRSLGTTDTRGIKIEGGVAAAPVPVQSIDLEVNFEYASATLSPDARLVLDNLGKALSDTTLKTSRFQLAGHTDSAGGDSYNLALSNRRAQSVADYLFSEHGIARARLSATGFGSTRLLDPVNPRSAVNRRVQVVNLGMP